MKRIPKEEYLEQAKSLNKEAAERLLARARTKLTRRLEDKTLSKLEVVALQLEKEDEDLNAWREKMAEIKKHHKPK